MQFITETLGTNGPPQTGQEIRVGGALAPDVPFEAVFADSAEGAPPTTDDPSIGVAMASTEPQMNVPAARIEAAAHSKDLEITGRAAQIEAEPFQVAVNNPKPRVAGDADGERKTTFPAQAVSAGQTHQPDGSAKTPPDFAAQQVSGPELTTRRVQVDAATPEAGAAERRGPFEASKDTLADGAAADRLPQTDGKASPLNEAATVQQPMIARRPEDWQPTGSPIAQPGQIGALSSDPAKVSPQADGEMLIGLRNATPPKEPEVAVPPAMPVHAAADGESLPTGWDIVRSEHRPAHWAGSEMRNERQSAPHKLVPLLGAGTDDGPRKLQHPIVPAAPISMTHGVKNVPADVPLQMELSAGSSVQQAQIPAVSNTQATDVDVASRAPQPQLVVPAAVSITSKRIEGGEAVSATTRPAAQVVSTAVDSPVLPSGPDILIPPSSSAAKPGRYTVSVVDDIKPTIAPTEAPAPYTKLSVVAGVSAGLGNISREPASDPIPLSPAGDPVSVRSEFVASPLEENEKSFLLPAGLTPQDFAKPVPGGAEAPVAFATGVDLESTPRAERVGAVLPLAIQPAPSLHMQVVDVIRSADSGTIDVQLSPEELGRVRISLNETDSGLQVVVHAERPETSDLLRRSADLLLREFREQGYSDVDLSFGRDPESGPEDQQHGAREPAATQEVWQEGNAPDNPRSAPSTARLDLRL